MFNLVNTRTRREAYLKKRSLPGKMPVSRMFAEEISAKKRSAEKYRKSRKDNKKTCANMF